MFLVGCSSQGVVNNQSMIKTTSASKAILNFIVLQTPNDKNIIFYKVKASILIDGKKIASLFKNESTQTLVSPGKHKISTKFELWPKDFTFNFEADKIYYFAVGIAPVKGLQYGDRASLTQLTKEEWESYN